MANGIQTGSDPQQCCTYEYQLLDKFCATRTEVWLCVSACMCMHVCVCMYVLCMSITSVLYSLFISHNCRLHAVITIRLGMQIVLIAA